jgi:hypothetical protein
MILFVDFEVLNRFGSNPTWCSTYAKALPVNAPPFQVSENLQEMEDGFAEDSMVR